MWVCLVFFLGGGGGGANIMMPDMFCLHSEHIFCRRAGISVLCFE